MLLSGADLIRTSGQQQERAVILEIAAAKEVKPPDKSPKSTLDEETQGALLRFARFIHKDGKRAPSHKKTDGNKKHPYIKAQDDADHRFEVGQNLDIYV